MLNSKHDVYIFKNVLVWPYVSSEVNFRFGLLHLIVTGNLTYEFSFCFSLLTLLPTLE